MHRASWDSRPTPRRIARLALCRAGAGPPPQAASARAALGQSQLRRTPQIQWRKKASSRRAVQQFDQFGGLLALLIGVAADDGALDAMTEVVLEHLRFHAHE